MAEFIIDEVLVLVIHGSPGDPERARREFAYLGKPSRPLEIVALSGEESVEAQLARVTQGYPFARLIVAPLLLTAGFHVQHDLLPAVQRVQDDGRTVELLPIWGRSASFGPALRHSLRLHFNGRRRKPASVLWLAPGGGAALASVRRQIDESGARLPRCPQHWATCIEPEHPRDALPIIAVLRHGRLSGTVRGTWTGPHRPRLLFSRAAMRNALLRWTTDLRPAVLAYA